MHRLMGALAGPIIWAAHFSLMYAAQAALCTGALGMSESAFVPAAIVLTVVAAGALLAVIGRQTYAARGAHGPTQPFLGRVGMLLAGLSLLAVVWSTLPAAALQACAPTAA